VFKLGGASDIPQPIARTDEPTGRPPARVGTPDQIAAGRSLFYTWCAKCHSLGVPAVTPDLSRLEGGIGDPEVFAAIVLKGALVSRGMSRFNDVLSKSDADELHDFLVDEAWKRYEAKPAPAAHAPEDPAGR
jgi:quinohemoprotein ethanol dehydrogenase